METSEEKKLGVGIPGGGDTKVIFICVKFEMAIRHLSDGVREAVEHMELELSWKTRAKYIVLIILYYIISPAALHMTSVVSGRNNLER